MVDSKENYKFDLGVKGLNITNSNCSLISAIIVFDTTVNFVEKDYYNYTWPVYSTNDFQYHCHLTSLLPSFEHWFS